MTEETQPTGQNPSGAEQEALEILATLLQANPLPEERYKDPEGQEHEGIYAMGSEAAQTLNCVAILRNGKIIPMISLQDAPEPKTREEKIILSLITASSILNGLLQAMLLQQDRGDEGEASHV